jgi:hypothetical protein
MSVRAGVTRAMSNKAARTHRSSRTPSSAVKRRGR